MAFSFMPTFSGTQLGHKRRAQCTNSAVVFSTLARTSHFVIPGFAACPEAGYPGSGFFWVSSFHLADVAAICHSRPQLLLHTFQFIILVLISG